MPSELGATCGGREQHQTLAAWRASPAREESRLQPHHAAHTCMLLASDQPQRGRTHDSKDCRSPSLRTSFRRFSVVCCTHCWLKDWLFVPVQGRYAFSLFCKTLEGCWGFAARGLCMCLLQRSQCARRVILQRRVTHRHTSGTITAVRDTAPPPSPPPRPPSRLASAGSNAQAHINTIAATKMRPPPTGTDSGKAQHICTEHILLPSAAVTR